MKVSLFYERKLIILYVQVQCRSDMSGHWFRNNHFFMQHIWPALYNNRGGNILIPGSLERCSGRSLEHVDLSLKISVGQVCHHHHLLGHHLLRLHHHHWSGLLCPRHTLLVSPVPHLDLSYHLVTGHCSGHWESRCVPGVLQQGGGGVGAELLDVCISEGSIIRRRCLDEVLLPVTRWQSRVLALSLGSQRLQLRVTLETRIVAQRLQFLLRILKTTFWVSTLTITTNINRSDCSSILHYCFICVILI